jgi:hypothetical protein
MKKHENNLFQKKTNAFRFYGSINSLANKQD